MEYNCGLTMNRHWFRYQAAAIIVEEGCVLFAGNETEDYRGIKCSPHVIEAGRPEGWLAFSETIHLR